jgi:hypothetical protein
MDLRYLTQKKGPLPVWGWALISAAILYILYRHFKGSGGSAASTPASTDTGNNGSTVADPPTVSIPENNGPDPLPITPADPLPNTGVGDNTILPWWADPGNLSDPLPPLASGNPTDPVVAEGSPISHPPVNVARTTKPALKSIIPGITGAVKSQKVLPNGAKLVTLKSGKQIEQAKGKKSYVVKKPAKKAAKHK